MAKYRATHRFARISAQKVRPFADLIRGKSAEDGLNQLRYMHNRGARYLEDVLKSAVANAEQQGQRNAGSLVISEARVDGGPMFKRIRPMSRGQAFVIRKRFAHISVGIDFPVAQAE